MSESLSCQGIRAAPRERGNTLFAQTMGYVAVAAGLFALGAYLGRHLSGGRRDRRVHRRVRLPADLLQPGIGLRGYETSTKQRLDRQCTPRSTR